MTMTDDADDTDLRDLPDRVEELICFALYSATHAMTKSYKPHLSAMGLTYPQYIAMVALWEQDGVTVGALCDRLMTETGTLTPILKRLESQGHIERKRSPEDERQVFITLTASGRALKDKAPAITNCIVNDTGVARADLPELVRTIGAMRDSLLQTRKDS